MKNMKYTFGALLLLISLCSCSNLFNKDVTKTKDSNTYVMLTSDSVSVRSISPTQEYALEKLKSITFYAKMDGKSKRTLASSVASLSVLYNYQFVLPDGAGFYTFELQGTLDSVNYYAKLTDIEIKEGETNPISFELKPVKGASDYSEFEDFGGLSCTLYFNKTNVNKIHYKLENLSSSNIVDQGDITSFSNVSNSSYNSKATYKHLANNTTGSTARLPVGQYRLTFDFLTEDTSLNDFVVINSFPYIVNVEKGRNSYLEENFDLSQVYTITYKANGGSLDLGSRMQTKFASKHEVMLPRMQKDGFTFQGWYTTSTFETGTGPIEKVEQGTTENKIFYAKFANSAIYVDPTTTNTINDGSEENPVTTLSAAIAKIKAIETTDQSDWLQWYIKVKGTITESLVIALNDDQMASPLKAKGVTFIGASDLINGEPQDVIQGEGTNPVFTIATSTQVHFKNIKITGGKDSEGYDGAGIVMKGNSIVTIENGTLITGNTASKNGGGIAVFDNANLMLAGGKITGNTCGTDKHGADVYCQTGGKIYVSGSPVVGDLVISDIYNNESSIAAIMLMNNLSTGASITITPEDYEYNGYPSMYYSDVQKSRYVYTISEEDIKLADNMKYFHVTPQSGSSREWYIDEEGCLLYDCKVTFTEDGTPIGTTATIPYGSSIYQDDTRFPTPEKAGYVFAGWAYKKLISATTGTYDARMFVYDSEYVSEVTYIIEDMELMPAWICESNSLYVNPTIGINFINYDDTNNKILFADGSVDYPYDSIKCALEAIYIRNNPNIDYTILIDGMTEEYNITIDDTIPARSITLQGKNTPAQGEVPADGILHGDGMYSNQNNPYQSLLLVSDNANVILKNIKIQMPIQGYSTDGIALNISSGANVTLDEGATFVGSGSQITPKGVIAVEDGASLIMKEGAVIKGFGLSHGAIYVKEGGSFTMNGGSIINNFTYDGGAVHISGGTFEMNSGSISENTTQCQSYLGNNELYGAGVCLVSGTFTMNDGYIKNNKAYVYNSTSGLTTAGGGVFVYSNGTFEMKGGEISGNAAIKADINTPDTIIDGDYAYGGGVCLQASGTKLASFTMTGGTIRGNTAGTSGNGIGFIGSLNEGVTGTIYLGDAALIKPDNDVYLPSSVTITIVESIMDDDDNPIKATITPQEYKPNQTILEVADNVTLEYEYDYFGVTPAGSTAWEINEEGKLVSSGM